MVCVIGSHANKWSLWCEIIADAYEPSIILAALLCVAALAVSVDKPQKYVLEAQRIGLLDSHAAEIENLDRHLQDLFRKKYVWGVVVIGWLSVLGAMFLGGVRPPDFLDLLFTFDVVFGRLAWTGFIAFVWSWSALSSRYYSDVLNSSIRKFIRTFLRLTGALVERFSAMGCFGFRFP
jgi:hypothetical protein